jgi:hypothetical protein
MLLQRTSLAATAAPTTTTLAFSHVLVLPRRAWAWVGELAPAVVVSVSPDASTRLLSGRYRCESSHFQTPPLVALVLRHVAL